MVATAGQQKGKAGERDVICRLQPIVSHVYITAGLTPPVLQRNLNQSRSGGEDILGIDWMSIEVKNHTKLNVGAWWLQALRQAGTKKIPILIYKDGRKWRVRLFTRLAVGKGDFLRAPADISWDDFLIYFEKRLKNHLTNQ